MTNCKHIICIVAAIVVLGILGGCHGGVDNSQLVDIDTLLAQNLAEDALQMLKAINTSSYNNKDRAY